MASFSFSSFCIASSKICTLCKTCYPVKRITAVEYLSQKVGVSQDKIAIVSFLKVDLFLRIVQCTPELAACFTVVVQSDVSLRFYNFQIHKEFNCYRKFKMSFISDLEHRPQFNLFNGFKEFFTQESYNWFFGQGFVS